MSTLEQRVAALENQMRIRDGWTPDAVEACKLTKEWPQIGDETWHINAIGEVYNDMWGDNFTDRSVKGIGNLYRTKKDAEAEVTRHKVMTELRDYAARVNGGWVRGEEDDGYYIAYEEGELIICCDRRGLTTMNQVYFRTEEGAQNATVEFGAVELEVLFV